MKNKEDYEIKIGDIEPGSEENIIEKQSIIASLYGKSFPLLLARASRFFPRSTHDQKDAIQEFFSRKVCTKSIERLKEIEKIGIAYMVKMFKYYLIDIHRRKVRERIEVEKYIEKETSAIIDIDAPGLEWIPIQERIRIIIKKHKKAVADNFRNEQYPEIFELMIQGYSNPEISEELGIKVTTIGTARHRIQKFMKNKKHGA